MKKTCILLFLVSTTPLAHSADLNNLNTTVTLGYQSRYVLYGYRLSEHLYHADIYVSLPINEQLTLWAGSWYGYLTDGTYNEIDVYTGMDWQMSRRFSAGLAYSMFNFLEVPFETSRQSHEVKGHITFHSGPFTLSLLDHYDTEGKGHLVRGIASFDRPLTESVGLILSAEYGYSFHYFVSGKDPHHALFKMSLPWQFNESLSFTPFIAHSLALDAIDSFQPDQTYGGLCLSVSF